MRLKTRGSFCINKSRNGLMASYRSRDSRKRDGGQREFFCLSLETHILPASQALVKTSPTHTSSTSIWQQPAALSSKRAASRDRGMMTGKLQGTSRHAAHKLLCVGDFGSAVTEINKQPPTKITQVFTMYSLQVGKKGNGVRVIVRSPGFSRPSLICNNPDDETHTATCE
ncbi:hypothetical protein MKZ38_001695 [Zalerion maritima]|uniref:Uncharacterized protein n=1 Tax=Zalerion maritima TaxID=339359 RepID=A0AAD5RQX1_9PEZI|nr:hypothetical protein MKZ38_001695 [Zalerion maritima]